MAKYKYSYHDERGQFHGYVEDSNGTTIWEVNYPDFYEDEESGELVEGSTIFEDGFMKNYDDVEGLENYLKSLDILKANDELVTDDIDDSLFNELEDYLESNDIYGYSNRIHEIMMGRDDEYSKKEINKYLQDPDGDGFGIFGYTRGIESIYDDIYAEGGSVEQGNVDMVKNQVIQVEHHAKELMETLKSNPQVDAWVVAKMDRATSNLSDITHYLEGKQNSFADGGETDSNTYEKVKVTIRDVDMGGDVAYKGDHWFRKDQLAKKTNKEIGDFILRKYGLDYGNTYKYSIVKTGETKTKMELGGENDYEDEDRSYGNRYEDYDENFQRKMREKYIQKSMRVSSDNIENYRKEHYPSEEMIKRKGLEKKYTKSLEDEPKYSPIKPQDKNLEDYLKTKGKDKDLARGGRTPEYETYHETLASVLDEAEDYVTKKGYKFTDESYFPDVTNGGIPYGVTQRVTRDAQEVGGKQRQNTLILTIYRMDSGRYELVMFLTRSKYASGGALESKLKKKLKESFELPMEMAVYVPSTDKANIIISKKDYSNRIEEVETFLSNLFGGYSAVSVDGGYVSNEKGLIQEDITRVGTFGSTDNFEANFSKLINKIVDWCNKWGQESIGFEFEGDMFYIDKNAKFKHGGFVKDKADRQRLINSIREGETILRGKVKGQERESIKSQVKKEKKKLGFNSDENLPHDYQ